MTDAKVWRPICYLEHVLYDETPLQIIVQYRGDESADKQVAKTFMVEVEWALMCAVSSPPLGVGEQIAARGPRFFTLRGRFSPSIRAAASTDAETIFQLLATTPQPPEIVNSLFPVRIRNAETDGAGANARAETFVLDDVRKGWWPLHIGCCAHLIHSSATRTWGLPLEANTIQGVIHAGKVLTSAGNMKLLKDKVTELVTDRIVVLVNPVDDGVRSAVMSFFLPQAQTPRKRAVMMAIAEFFNGAWGKQKTLQHICAGQHCCKDREETTRTAGRLLRKMVSCLLGRVFSRANWAAWAQSLEWFCFSDALHGLVTDAFQQCFKKHTSTGTSSKNDATVDAAVFPELLPEEPSGAANPRDPADGVDDNTARQRLENAISTNISLHFMVSGVWKEVYLLRVCLHAQKTLMATVLHCTSQDWELAQQFNLLQTGAREYRLLNLHKGDMVTVFFAEVSRLFHSITTWVHFLETERFRSRILQAFMRSAAVVFQLMVTRLKGYPYALLSVLDPGSRDSAVAMALAAPRCMLDTWSRRFLEMFPGEDLKGQEAQAVLELVAEVGMGTTFSTERLHSRNLSRAKQRQSRKADVQYLGLSHMGFSAPSSCRHSAPSAQVTSGNRPGRPRKKDKADPQRRGGGGAWRAYVSAHLGGRYLKGEVATELSAGYRALTQEQKAHYQLLGQLGTD